jgi:SAM-dependent methyltransferase
VTDLFDAAAMYDEDYLHFLAPAGGVAGPEVDVVGRLLDLEPEMTVLDVGCGHGALANGLAALGCRVTGLDSSRVFLDRARADAEALGVDVEYVEGDMRSLPWTDRFDRIVNWSTAFGYFEDDVNREVLAGFHRALRAGGALAMDLDNLVHRLRTFQQSLVKATGGDGGMLVDRNFLDPLTGRLEVVRTVVRGGTARDVSFVVRLFGFPELRDWLLAAGFSDVSAHGEDGESLTADHRRMVVTASRP